MQMTRKPGSQDLLQSRALLLLALRLPLPQLELQRSLGQCFDKVRVIKPPASRSDSSEAYVAASGYRPAERESSA